MSQKKKKKRPEVAQQLIDSLLDEPTLTQNVVVPVSFSKSVPSLNPILNPRKFDSDSSELSLEDTGTAPPFEGTQPLVTQMLSEMPPADNEFSLGDIDLSSPKVVSRKQEEPSSDFGEQTVKLETVPQDERYDFPADEFVAVPELRLAEKKIKEDVSPFAATEIRTGFQAKNLSKAPAFTSTAFVSSEAALKQSESLRIAQNRLLELEGELEKLRRENEQLASAGDTLRRRSGEMLSRAENVENHSREIKRSFEEEKKVLQGQMQSKERENNELRGRLEEIETRLEGGFKKIRVRERELEHRLEIVKMETMTLVSTKDRMILELKRQVDQLNHETEHGKRKSQELFNQYKEKQETIRRVVRALRIALTILEGDEDAVVPLKKAD
jgi:hypothetical protein